MKDRGRIITLYRRRQGKNDGRPWHGSPGQRARHEALVIQFVKSDTATGELAACRHLAGVEIVQAGRGFIPERTSDSFQEHCQAAREGLDLAEQALTSGKYI